MKMNILDVWIWEQLKTGKNPMFTIGELSARYQTNGYRDSSSQGHYYRAVQRSITKFEKFGLLHVYRVTNQGTVFMLKGRAL